MVENNLQNYTGKYKGQQLMADNAEYKKYKLTFHSEGWDTNFTAFMPWTKKDGTEKKGVNPANLVLDKEYRLGFSQKKFNGGMSNTLVAIFEAKKGTAMNYSPPKQATGGLNIDINKDPSWGRLIDSYFQLNNEKTRTKNHFIGTLIRTKFPKEVEQLVEEYKRRTAPVDVPATMEEIENMGQEEKEIQEE